MNRELSIVVKFGLVLGSLGATIALGLASCASEDTATQTASGEQVTKDDVVQVDDLVVSEKDNAGAGSIGQPATLLGLAKQEAKVSRDAVATVFDLIKEIAQDKAPTSTGTTKAGLHYGLWTQEKAGVNLKFWVIRTAANRLRYLMTGSKAAGPQRFLLTGVFIKAAPHVGGGRLHVSLTNATELFGAPGKTGSMHVWFANHKKDVRGRRIAFVNVNDAKNPGLPVNVVADAVYWPGVAGQMRTVAVEDFSAKLPGNEALAMRVRYKVGAGGRADAVMASLAGGKPTKLGEAHECWDKDGNRTGYLSAPEDPNNKTEGTVTKCIDWAQDSVPDGAAAADGKDPDPDLDALLKDSGAAAIDVSEADSQDGAQ